MSGFFVVGEKKERPGVYKRYENAGGVEAAGARSGVGCALVTGNWGALNTPVTIDQSTDISNVIGAGSGYDAITAFMAGGMEECVVVRVGTGGTPATITLKDTTASAAVDAVVLTALHPGDRAFTITVKTSLDDETAKEATIYEGTKALEKATFAAGKTEVDGIVAAFANSKYVKATRKAPGNGTLADITQKAFTAGTNPTVNTAAYGEAANASEAEVRDMIIVGTNDAAVHTLIATHVARVFQEGAYTMATVAEPSSVAIETRMQHAAAFNDEKIHYVLNPYIGTDGVEYEGYMLAARIGGLICAGAANASLTHTVISGAAGLKETLNSGTIKKALKSGCLVLSTSKSKQVWIEKAINTLVTLSKDQDAGWKKIRRVKERFELMDRVEQTTEVLIGQVDNDPDGRAAVIAAAQRVVDAMVGEKKLLSGTVIEDEGNPAQGDSAWFIIAVDDLDSIETIYLTFRFRFAAEEDSE